MFLLNIYFGTSQFFVYILEENFFFFFCNVDTALLIILNRQKRLIVALNLKCQYHNISV